MKEPSKEKVKEPRIIDFEKERTIREISQLLRACRVSFCAALLHELRFGQEDFLPDNAHRPLTLSRSKILS